MAGSISAAQRLDSTAPKKRRNGDEPLATTPELTDPGIEPQTCRTNTDGVTTTLNQVDFRTEYTEDFGRKKVAASNICFYLLHSIMMNKLARQLLDAASRY